MDICRRAIPFLFLLRRSLRLLFYDERAERTYIRVEGIYPARERRPRNVTVLQRSAFYLICNSSGSSSRERWGEEQEACEPLIHLCYVRVLVVEVGRETGQEGRAGKTNWKSPPFFVSRGENAIFAKRRGPSRRDTNKLILVLLLPLTAPVQESFLSAESRRNAEEKSRVATGVSRPVYPRPNCRDGLPAFFRPYATISFPNESQINDFVGSK